MLSEDMRRLADAPGEFQTLKPHLLRKGADTIDALLRALESVAADRGHVHLNHETWFDVQTALALARGGK